MSTNEVALCNIALGWVGGNLMSGSTLPVSPSTIEELLCVSNYVASRDMTLEARNWTFATTRSVLTPTVNSPAFEFTKEYDVPSDCLRIIALDSDADMQNNIDWVTEEDVIFCDASSLYIKYVKRITTTTLFSAHFDHACAARIAANIAIPLTGSDNIMKLMEAKYKDAVEDGGAYNGLQGKNQEIRSNQLIRAR